MATTTQAWEYLQNASLFKATTEIYEVAWGLWFWPIIFMFTLFVVAIKTESPAFVAIYAILGNLALSRFLIPASHPIFFGTLIFSIAMVLWSLFGSNKID